MFKNDLQNENLFLYNILIEDTNSIYISPNIKSFKILFHDDLDGVMSSIVVLKTLLNKGYSLDKITVKTISDATSLKKEEELINKTKNQMLLVVDYNRFKTQNAPEKIDFLSDHHKIENEEEFNKTNADKQKQIKSEFGSEVLHLSSTVCQNILAKTDLIAVTKVDSADFDYDLIAANLFLNKKGNSVEEKKTKLAIICANAIDYLLRKPKYNNEKFIEYMIKEVAQHPTINSLYNFITRNLDLYIKYSEMIKKIIKGYALKNDIIKFNEQMPDVLKLSLKKNYNTEENKFKKTISSIEDIKNLNSLQVKGNFIKDNNGEIKLKNDEITGYITQEQFVNKNLIYTKDRDEVNRRTEFWISKNPLYFYLSPAAQKIYFNKKRNIIFSSYFEKTKQPMAGIVRYSEHITLVKDFKANRYLSFLDKRIYAAIRDFDKFFQINLSPYYKEKLKNINLIDIMNETFDYLVKEKLTKTSTFYNSFIEHLKKDKYQKISPEIFEQYFSNIKDIFIKKIIPFSGGHRGIITISLEPLYNYINKYSLEVEKLEKKVETEKISEATLKKYGAIASSFLIKSYVIDFFFNNIKYLFLEYFVKKLENLFKDIK